MSINSRRGSLLTALNALKNKAHIAESKCKGGSPEASRRGVTNARLQGIKESRHRGGPSDSTADSVPKEGEVYYRTVKIFPSIPDSTEEVTIQITKSWETLWKESASPASRKERRSASERSESDPRCRGTHRDREDSLSPNPSDEGQFTR